MKTETLTKTKWALDVAHSEIGFKVKHLMISNVRGSFGEFNGSIYTTGEDFMSVEADVWINPASVKTGDEKRDGHLKSPEFFDVEKHKEITFTANTIEKFDKDGSFELWGDLTIKGIKKQVKLDVEFGGIMKDPWGNQKAGAARGGTGCPGRSSRWAGWRAARSAGSSGCRRPCRSRCWRPPGSRRPRWSRGRAPPGRPWRS